MIRSTTSLPNVALFIAIFLILSVAGKVQAQQKGVPGTPQTAAKVERLLKESGLNNKKYSEGVWLAEAPDDPVRLT